MLFRKKNKEKNKQSDYQELKDIILNNDNQASMDEAINNWQVDTDNIDSFIDELSEKYSELCMDHVPLAIESLYKSNEKIKTMIFCMLFEFTCVDLPYVTNLENIPLFEAKLEYIYHTLVEVFSSCYNGIGDCVGLIILNCDPDMSFAQPEEKQRIISSVQERLELLYKYVSENGCAGEDIISALSVTLDMATRLNNDNILVSLRNLSKLQLDLESELFLVKAMALNDIPVSLESIDRLVEFDASRLIRILGSIERMDLLNECHITQEKIAYAEMRNWLCHPSECGNTLDALEFVDTLIHDEYRYYIFKFTSTAPKLKERGFMIGVAGGYDMDRISDNETGHTFSDFETIGDNYKEQALNIIQMISDYWKRAAEQAR